MLIITVACVLIVEFLNSWTNERAVELSNPRVLLSQHCSQLSLMKTSAMLVRRFSPPLMPLIIALPMGELYAASSLNFAATLRPISLESEPTLDRFI